MVLLIIHFVPKHLGMMTVGTEYNMGSDPALWSPQGPMQGMAGGGGVPYPMNPGMPYNTQGGFDISGYPVVMCNIIDISFIVI